MNKKLFLFAIPLLLAVSAIAVGIYYHEVAVNIQVDEALDSTTMAISISPMYAGEVRDEVIVVNNKANVPLKTLVTWNSTGTDGVNLTTNLPKLFDLASGDNNLVITFSVDGSSLVGQENGTITLTRV